jgi:ferredoxin
VLALAGFAVSGHATNEIMSDRATFAVLKARTNWPDAEESATLAWLRLAARLGFLALAAAAIGFAVLRRLSSSASQQKAQINYIGGPTIGARPGMTLLEVSRSAGIAHASVCGGRGRCSTCRVRVEEGLDSLPRPSGTERATLRSIEAPANVRLACQILPAGDLTIALISGPATPGPPQDSFDDIKEFVSAHVRGILDDRLVDFRSQDPAAVTEWLFQEGTEAVAVRDLAASGYRLEGVRIEFVMNRRKAALVYQWQAHFITLFQSLQHESALAMRGQRNGYHVLAWTDDGLAFVAVSEVEAEELDRLQEALRPSEPVLKTDAHAAVL